MKYKLLNIILDNIEKENKNFYPIRKINLVISKTEIHYNLPDKNIASSFLKFFLEKENEKKYSLDKIFFSFENFNIQYIDDCFLMEIRKDFSKESIKSIVNSFESFLGPPVKNKDLSLSKVNIGFFNRKITYLFTVYKLKKGVLEIRGNYKNKYIEIELKNDMMNFLNQVLFNLRTEKLLKIESVREIDIDKMYETGEVYIDTYDNFDSISIKDDLEKRINIINFKVKHGQPFKFKK